MESGDAGSASSRVFTILTLLSADSMRYIMGCLCCDSIGAPEVGSSSYWIGWKVLTFDPRPFGGLLEIPDTPALALEGGKTLSSQSVLTDLGLEESV